MSAGAVRGVLLSLSCIFVFGALPEAGADLYKYQDSKGTVCVTDKLESVPAKYRAGMQVIRDNAGAGSGKSDRKQVDPLQSAAAEPSAPGQAAVAPDPAAGGFGQLAARYPWLEPLAIVFGIVVGFLVVSKISQLLPSRQLGRLVCLAFALGVVIFGYKSYGDQMTSRYLQIKEKVLNASKKTGERERLQRERTAEAAGEAPEKR